MDQHGSVMKLKTVRCMQAKKANPSQVYFRLPSMTTAKFHRKTELFSIFSCVSALYRFLFLLSLSCRPNVYAGCIVMFQDTKNVGINLNYIPAWQPEPLLPVSCWGFKP